MKELFLILVTVLAVFTLTACENQETQGQASNQNNNSQEENKDANNNGKEKQQENKKEENNNTIVDDEDNKPPQNETAVVDKIINCDGCVFAYFSDEGDKAKKIGSTLSPDEYTTDINNIKTAGKKQRHNFFGLILSDNKIVRAHACIYKDNKIYCIEGSTNGAYQDSNIAILKTIFTADQCKTISAGHTYWCSDGNYNGDTKDTGYASMHYETSCTIYGGDSNTGKLICH